MLWSRTQFSVPLYPFPFCYDLYQEDAEYRGRVAQLSVDRQLWYWHSMRCSPTTLYWRRGQFHRECRAKPFSFWYMFILQYVVYFIFPLPSLFLMDSVYSCNMFESFYITLVPSANILAFILFGTSVAHSFVKSDLSSFHIRIGDCQNGQFP